MNKKGEAEVVIVFAVIALFVIIISGFSVAVGAVAPYGYKITPTNGTSNSSLSIQFVFNATDDTALKNATLYVWNSTNSQVYTNFTVITGTFNLSSIWNVFTQAGLFFWNVLISDSSSDLNWTYGGNYSFTITDATPPYFTYLANVSIQTNDSVNIDYNATDNLVLDNWITNDTRFSINASGWFKNSSGLSVGLIFVNITINDTSNNKNSSVVFVNISAVPDLTVPAITILLPANTSYASTTSTFNVTLNENGTDCLYSLDGAGNITMTNKNNSDFGAINSTMAQGSHNVIYSCNDTSNNRNASVTRYFSTDSIAPYFTYLANVSIQNNDSVGIDYNATDTIAFENFSVNDTRFSINSSGWFKNTSGLSIGVIFVNITINDTANNKNSSVVFVNVTSLPDITAPVISLISPADAYSTTSTSATFSYNITDVSSIANCSLLLNNAIAETGTSITVNITQTFTRTLTAGSYNWSVNCTDSSNNQGNSSSRNLTITQSSTAASTGSTGGGAGGSYGLFDTPSTNLKIMALLLKGNKYSIKINDNKDTGIIRFGLISNNDGNGIIDIYSFNNSQVPLSCNINNKSVLYNYLEINSTIKNENIKSVNLSFEINKSWINKNNISKIYFSRCYPSNENIAITLENETVNKEIYSAEFSGFSIFAVTGEKAITSAEKSVNVSPKDSEKIILERKPVLSSYLISAGILIIIIAVIVWIFMQILRKRK